MPYTTLGKKTKLSSSSMTAKLGAPIRLMCYLRYFRDIYSYKSQSLDYTLHFLPQLRVRLEGVAYSFLTELWTVICKSICLGLTLVYNVEYQMRSTPLHVGFFYTRRQLLFILQMRSKSPFKNTAYVFISQACATINLSNPELMQNPGGF